MRALALPVIALAGLSLGACAMNGAGNPLGLGGATAALKTADGTPVGAVTALATANGISIEVAAVNMPAGSHGVHIHMVGSCADAFAAAGGHWNPDGSRHGLSGTDGQHAGDMPNLEIAANGTGRLSYRLAPSATFAGLMDADGSAFIVHAAADDQATDPAGNSGARIACGVFTAG